MSEMPISYMELSLFPVSKLYWADEEGDGCVGGWTRQGVSRRLCISTET